ncbi:MAG: NAD-dependent epimerase/dehydratase family protein [bacterium]
MNECLIIGGGGFLGSHLTKRLLEKNYKVRILELPHKEYPDLTPFLDKIKLIKGDFTKPSVIQSAVIDVDFVFHLACTVVPQDSMEDIAYDLKSNVIGSIQLFEVCRKQKIKKIIFSSSGGTVYGIPQTLPIPELHPTYPLCSYGITKLTIEKYLYMYHHLYKLDYVILRTSNFYGGRLNTFRQQGAIDVFLNKVKNKEPIIIWGDGTVVRDYIYIDDVVEAFILSCEMQTKNKIFNIGDGKGTSLNELLNIIRKVTGKEFEIQYKQGRPYDVPINVLDIKRAKQELCWQPKVSLMDGILYSWQEIKLAS